MVKRLRDDEQHPRDRQWAIGEFERFEALLDKPTKKFLEHIDKENSEIYNMQSTRQNKKLMVQMAMKAGAMVDEIIPSVSKLIVKQFLSRTKRLPSAELEFDKILAESGFQTDSFPEETKPMIKSEVSNIFDVAHGRVGQIIIYSVDF